MLSVSDTHLSTDLLANPEPSIQRLKLLVPSPVSQPVARDSILDLLTQQKNTKLVLFRAPAGFGKTTAMRQYLDVLERNHVATAWITLDALDDDFRRFLIHLIAALKAVLKRQGASIDIEHAGASTPGTNMDEVASDLLEKITDCQHPFTLFIDNFEAVSNRSIDDLLRLVLNRLPPRGQIAIASRKVPDLQLGRLRVQGQLVEVNQARLQFSHDETEAFLRSQHGLSLSAADVSKLQGDTEGWPAALWLAATALEHKERPGSFIASFSGSNTAVAEYLAEEVLYQQPEDVQIFLLRTSILSDLNKSVCDEICKITDSDVILRRLMRSSVCVSTIDSERQIYRYHALFSEFLRSQLSRLYSSEIPGLHRTAMRWYHAAGRPIQAIEHALFADDLDYALSLLDSHADSLLFQGRFCLLARWLDRVPKESLRAKPQLRLAHIWALTFTRRATEALKLMDALAADESLIDKTNDVTVEIQALRPFILMALDRHEEGSWLAEQAPLKRLHPTNFSYNILTTTRATWQVAANKYGKALELLQSSGADDLSGMTKFPTVYAICVEGHIALVQAHVRQAVAHFRVALSQAAAAFGTRSFGKSIAAVYLAESLYEIDELHEAEQLLALYLPAVREHALPDQFITSHVIQARIAFEHSDADHAFRLLSELEYFGRHGNLPRVLASAQLERARIALSRGDLAEAQSHYDRATNPEAWNSLRGLIMPAHDVENLDLCRFRLASHGVGRDAAMTLLKAEIKSAQANQRNRRLLKLNIFLAEALYSSGQRMLAMRKIESALQTASQEGLVRTFLDEGAPVIELLREFQVARKESSDTDQNNALTQFTDLILRKAGCSVDLSVLVTADIDSSAILTLRELQILESLSLGLSNRAIASNLFVAETTVRSHLRKINVKLGVGNRTQAVNISRRLGLIK